MIGEIWSFAEFPAAYEGLLSRSGLPRASAEFLHELAARVPLVAASVVVDAGCYDASQSEFLVHATGCRLIGIDLSRLGAEARRQAMTDPSLRGRVRFVQGRLEALPIRTATADLTWCRDAISCAPATTVVPELTRITRPHGHVILHTTCATPLLEPRERAWLYDTLAIAAESMDKRTLEGTLTEAGLRIVEHVRVGSQSLQARTEHGDVNEHLLRVARLHEYCDDYVQQWGDAWYQRILAWETWPIYTALDKLEDHIWLLEAT